MGSSKGLIDQRKSQVLKIVESYYFEEKGQFNCKYLESVMKIGLGRFSTEYRNGKWSSDELYDFHVQMVNPIPEPKRRVKSFRPKKPIRVSELAKDKIFGDAVKTLLIQKFNSLFRINDDSSQSSNVFREEQCLICLSSDPSRLFLPCKHLAVCDDCLEVGDFNKCPVCRKEIKMIL